MIDNREKLPIEDLREIQRDKDLTHTHLVHFAEDGWTLVHTDAERDSGMDLQECEVHKWVASRLAPPIALGIYKLELREPRMTTVYG